jgi:ubiquinone/menaquinone biosynthesis C-methylase UbiE
MSGNNNSDAPEASDTTLKQEVRAHWEAESAGVRYGTSDDDLTFYRQVRESRYQLEPYIPGFANFGAFAGKDILEIGVGAGVDFSNWVDAGAKATGVDLTEAGLAHTRQQLRIVDALPDSYELMRADAENLPFDDGAFDLVYSWGVLHHTPDTRAAFAEALRVLKPGGTIKAMVYHTPSWTGWMLWAIHGLLRGRPLKSPKQLVYERLESPGTKVFSVRQITDLLQETGFENVSARTQLGPGDLLTIKPSGRYQSLPARVIWKTYPRWLVRLLGDRFGLGLLVEARRPVDS